MTPLIFFLILVNLSATVASQIWLKRAMGSHRRSDDPLPMASRRWLFGLAVFSMALSFFITLGLLQQLDLSFLFPFQALTVVIIAISARIFLKEHFTPRLIVGLVLISVGVALVAKS